MTNLLSRADPAARAIGYVNWTLNPYLATAQAITGSGEVEAIGIWLPFNVPVGHIVVNVAVAGAGAQPTGFFVGIGNRTKMLVQSANLAANTDLQATGLKSLPLANSYTPVPSDSEDGYFYVVILQNGAFATPIQLTRTGGIQVPYTGFGITAGRAGTGQTVLPANGATYSTALAAAGSQNFWVGVAP